MLRIINKDMNNKRPNSRQQLKAVAKLPNKLPARIQRRTVPKAEFGLTVDLTLHWSRKNPTREDDLVIKGSLTFQEADESNHPKLFLHKVSECAKLCDFSNHSKDSKAKATKTILLKHLIDCFNNPSFLKLVTPEMMDEFYKMVSVNIVRDLPQFNNDTPIGAIDSFYDEAWPHLQLVYKVLTASLESAQTSVMSPSFIYKVVNNGCSPDQNERMSVRDFLHSLYSKYMNHRQTIRRCVSSVFELCRCSSELLDLYCSIVQGLTSPLKSEHVNFFYRSLLPLATLCDFNTFCDDYFNVVRAFIQKNNFLFNGTLNYVFSHWPRRDSRKQQVFLNFLVNLMKSNASISDNSLILIFTKFADSITSENADIANMAMDSILDNENMFVLLREKSSIIFPLMFEKVYRTAKNHWDPDVKQNAVTVLQTMSELDKTEFDKIQNDRKAKREKNNTQSAHMKSNWLQIFETAKKNDKCIKALKIDIVQ